MVLETQKNQFSFQNLASKSNIEADLLRFQLLFLSSC